MADVGRVRFVCLHCFDVVVVVGARDACATREAATLCRACQRSALPLDCSTNTVIGESALSGVSRENEPAGAASVAASPRSADTGALAGRSWTDYPRPWGVSGRDEREAREPDERDEREETG